MKRTRNPSSRAAERDASPPAASTRPPSTRRRVMRNPLFGPLLGSPFVRTNGPTFRPPFRPARNPLIVSPSFRAPAVDDELRVVGEAPNPSAWESQFMRALEVAAGSLGGFGWNLLAGSTVRSMNIESQNVNDALGYLGAAAPALAFATFLAGDEAWKSAMAGASLYDFWTAIARKLGVGQLDPSPPRGAT